MQGQRSALDSFPETVDLNQGSVSNNTDMDHSSAWNNMLNPVENRLSNYALSSSEGSFSCMNAVGHNDRSFSGWDLGESSSSASLQDQGDGLKVEHGWSSSFNTCSSADARLVERQYEPSIGSGLGGNQVTGEHMSMQSSGSSHMPVNVNLNARYAGDIDDGGQGVGAGLYPSFYKPGVAEVGQIPSASASDEVGTSSDTLGTWGLSCKRKALEGTSGQSYPSGSSSCIPQTENIALNTVPARHNASSSLSISSPPMNSPSVGRFEQLNSRMGVGTRGVASDVFPPLSVTGIVESSHRNYGVRITQGHQEPVLSNVASTGSSIRRSSVRSPHQSSRPMSFTDSFEFRPTSSVSTNLNSHSNQSHLIHLPGLPRNTHPYPWSGALNSRPGSSSSSLTLSGDRGAALREEANFRGTLRNNAEHPPMFVTMSETRNLVQDPTNWSLATGSSSSSGGAPPSSRVGPGSGARPFPTVWVPHHNPPTQNSQRLTEFAPWSLFPPVESEAGGQRSHFPPYGAGPSSSSSSSPEETGMSSGANSQGHHQSYPRSLLEVPDDVNGWRALAADIEGRQRLVSEIRQVLNAMRRGESLRAEDYMLFDPFINGVAEMHDRHRDMRLDVDNMSYEELLALEERIGDVNTGLSEETILETMKQQKYLSTTFVLCAKMEPCCICQEEYVNGDDIGTLQCGHDFHTACIKQWLMQKNLCPICKMTGLGT
ncbi:hypothetical protein LguiA_008835 [Lonicera macranthoides]